MLIEQTKKLAKDCSPYRAAKLAVAAMGTCLFLSSVAQAAPASFRAFEGVWAGTGTLSHRNGVTERIRCRADYVLRGAQSLQQTLRCQSDTTKFDIVSRVTDEAGRLTGEWTETNRNVRGTLTGTIRRGQIRAQVQGASFSAGIGIAVRGSRQSVGIRAAGTDITGVRISLRRTRR